MATCVLSAGYSLTCRDSQGGIQKIYIGTYNGSSLTYTFDADMTIGTFSGATVSFYTFEQENEAATYNQVGKFSSENGTSFYEQTAEIVLQKLDAALRNTVTILGQGKWRIIVLDQRGNYWLMGAQNPVRVTAATPGVGKAYADLNGSKITFLGNEPVPAYKVSTAAALSVIQPIV